MRSLAALVALVALLLACCALAQDVTNCGSDTDDIAINSISMSPDPPVRGQNLTLVVDGDVKTEVDGGKVTLEVYMSGIKIYTNDWDLCTTFGSWVNCPVPTGAFHRSVSEVFPSFVPPGHFTGKIFIVDTSGRPVACAAFDIKEVPSPDASAIDDLDAPILHDHIIATVNSGASSWVAHRSPRFEGVTRRQARRLLGARLDSSSAHSTVRPVVLRSEGLPDSFDARTKWGKCVHPIRNQEQCGSCWAFGAAEALSDRFCIAGTDVILSPQDLVSCDHGNYGCQGGYLPVAWQYMESHGICTDSCFPYASGGGHAPQCLNNKCKDGSAAKYYKVKKGSIVQPKGIESIETTIFNGGPVEAAFSVYQDFFSYKSGVYVHRTGGLEGGHAIKIIGWGNDNGTPYWIVANSWGTSWGINGYFWIKKGVNECGIESNVIAGAPDV